MHSKRYGTSAVSRLSGFRVTRDVTSRAIIDALTAFDCPRALTIAILYEHEEWQQLVDLVVDPKLYCNLVDARAAYCATMLLSKYEDFGSLAEDRDVVAFRKFLKFELSCRALNRNFKSWRNQNFRNSGVASLLSAMSHKIANILGPVNVKLIFDSCAWGPGASTKISSRRANSPHKFQYETGITRKFYDLLCPRGSMAILEGYSPRWSQRLVEAGFPDIQHGNKVVTVPKDSKSNRVIAIEPGLNLWFQKGVGEVMKRRLKVKGIDLRDQSRNMELARQASLDGSLATIDFSSASDSVAYELVKELFPKDWFELLDCLRCGRGFHKDETYTWEKFSSMGNGCTFEIESLIFYALALTCADFEKVDSSRISIYGDDVILPVELYDSFHHYSQALGFSFNSKKSYATSPFRESCGAHWYGGSDVKPVYLKGRLNTIQSVYRFANSIRRLAHRWMSYSACDARFESTFYRLVHSVPRSLRLRVPEGIGDGGFLSNFDEATPKRAKRGFEGFLVKHVVDLSISAEVEHDGLLLDRLRGSGASPDPATFADELRIRRIKGEQLVTSLPEYSKRASRNSVTHRDHTEPRISEALVPQWYDLGMWY